MKTYLLAVFCCIRCILYPGTKIAVAAPTRGQGNQILEKIEKELMKRSFNLWYEIKYIKYNNNIGECYFKNGSYIKIVTMADTARSARANIIFIDEFVKSKKDIIDSVIKKFLVAEREPKFYSKPEYKSYPKERNKEIYCSSAYTKANWGYTKLKGYVDNIILSSRKYFVCTLPYQIAILEGLLSRAQVEDEMSESDFNALTWSMEMECLFYGDAKESFYKFDNINARRILKDPFPKLEDVMIGNAKVPKLLKGERRVLSVDVALMASTKHDNDASSIMINSAIRGGGSVGNYISNYRLIDSLEGITTNDLGMTILRYFNLYECTDLALDTNGVGLGVFDYLILPHYDAVTGIEYSPLTTIDSKDPMAQRCTYPNAKKVIWSIKATENFNSQIAQSLRNAINVGKINLLIDEHDAERKFMESKKYRESSAEDKVSAKMPFYQTTLLVNELINLRVYIKDNKIKQYEKRGYRKDRVSSMQYNNYVVEQLSLKRKRGESDDGYLPQLVFKKPILHKQ